MHRRTFVACGAAAAWSLAAPAQAQTYPDKPIRLVVPFAPGGSTDMHARALGAKLAELLRQQVVIDNRAGAGGALAAEYVARAAPDGYTLLFGSIATHGIIPKLHAKVGYDPLKDFVPIAMIGQQPNFVAVHPSFPHDTVAKFVAAAKAAPGKIAYGSPGAGSSPQLSVEIFKSVAGIDLLHIPYKGGGPALADAVAGHLPVVVANIDSVKAQVEAGKLKGLFVTGRERSPLLPNVPTLVESGYPTAVIYSWSAMFAPAGTPAPIVERLERETLAAVASDEVGNRLRQGGFMPGGPSRAELPAFVASQLETWGTAIRNAGIKPE